MDSGIILTQSQYDGEFARAEIATSSSEALRNLRMISSGVSGVALVDSTTL